MIRRRSEAWLSHVLKRLVPVRNRCSWTVRGRDGRGKPVTAVVALTEGFVTVEGVDRGTIRLTAAQVDRLRVALRAAVIELDQVDDSTPCTGPMHAIPVQRSGEDTREVDHSGG